jgi:hypothetical protein
MKWIRSLAFIICGGFWCLYYVWTTSQPNTYEAFRRLTYESAFFTIAFFALLFLKPWPFKPKKPNENMGNCITRRDLDPKLGIFGSKRSPNTGSATGTD